MKKKKKLEYIYFRWVFFCRCCCWFVYISLFDRFSALFVIMLTFHMYLFCDCISQQCLSSTNQHSNSLLGFFYSKREIVREWEYHVFIVWCVTQNSLIKNLAKDDTFFMYVIVVYQLHRAFAVLSFNPFSLVYVRMSKWVWMCQHEWGRNEITSTTAVKTAFMMLFQCGLAFVCVSVLNNLNCLFGNIRATFCCSTKQTPEPNSMRCK